MKKSANQVATMLTVASRMKSRRIEKSNSNEEARIRVCIVVIIVGAIVNTKCNWFEAGSGRDPLLKTRDASMVSASLYR